MGAFFARLGAIAFRTRRRRVAGLLILLVFFVGLLGMSYLGVRATQSQAEWEKFANGVVKERDDVKNAIKPLKDRVGELEAELASSSTALSAAEGQVTTLQAQLGPSGITPATPALLGTPKATDSTPAVWVTPTPVPEWVLPMFSVVKVNGIANPEGQKIADSADDELTSMMQYDPDAPVLIFEDTDGVMGFRGNRQAERDIRWRIPVDGYTFRGKFTVTWSNDSDAFGRGLLRSWMNRYGTKYRAPIAAALASYRIKKNASATGGASQKLPAPVTPAATK